MTVLSIITPVFNGKRFIARCLDNVIAQDCPEAEHIVVDGGSTDGTTDILAAYAGRHGHLRWVSGPDAGQSDAMNKGLAMARGAVVSFLNADDYYEPGVLRRVVARFRTLPEPTLLVGNCNSRDAAGRILDVNRPRDLRLTSLLVGLQHASYPCNPSAYFYHRSLHERVGPYAVGEHFVMDVRFLLAAVEHAHVCYVDETWGNFSYQPGGKTFDDQLAGRSFARIDAVMRERIKTLPWAPRWRVQTLRILLRLRLGVFYYAAHPRAIPRKLAAIFGFRVSSDHPQHIEKVSPSK